VLTQIVNNDGGVGPAGAAGFVISAAGLTLA